MKIDKNIPLPEPFRVKRKRNDVYMIVAKMEIGDSFIAPSGMIFAGSFSVKCHLEKKYGIKLVQRKTDEGLRIWRIA